MTKSEAHSYIKFNAHLDSDSYSKPPLYSKKGCKGKTNSSRPQRKPTSIQKRRKSFL